MPSDGHAMCAGLIPGYGTKEHNEQQRQHRALLGQATEEQAKKIIQHNGSSSESNNGTL